MNRIVRMLPALALVAVSGAALALPYDTTGAAGTYNTLKSSTVVRGTGSPLTNIAVFVPWILNRTDASQNASVAGVDANGGVVSAVTTFTGNPPPVNTVRVIAALGTTDAAWPSAGPGGSSNNVFLSEGLNPLSNSFGELTGDLTAVWRANFSGGIQNNLEYRALPLNQNSPAPASGSFQVFDPSFPGIDATPGSVFLGVPGADRLGQNLYTGVTMFDGGTGNCPSGTAVYLNDFNDPNAPLVKWLQVNTPIPAPALVTEIRQTQPAVKRINLGQGCADAVSIAFGVGVSPGTGSTTPYSGGSARPLFIVVSPVSAAADGYTLPYRIIRADGGTGVAGPVSNAIRFVSTQATGGGTGPLTGGMFDINSKGQVAAVIEDRTGSVFVYRVVRYDPIVSNCQITGYNAPVVIAQSGQDTILAQVQNTVFVAASGGNPAQVVTNTLVPFSGVAIDDDGNVAFTAVTEKFDEVRTVSGTGATGVGPVLFASTNDLFFFEAVSNTLHSIVKGGQNGDVLNNAASGGPQLSLGFFPIDTASDSFTRSGLSPTGRALSVAFRSCSFENGVLVPGATPPSAGFTIRGGVLRPGVAGQETSVRGVVNIKLPAAQTPCPGDYNGDRIVNFLDLNIVLSGFGTTYNFINLNLVLSNFGVACP